jgi:hypothetical protein
MKILGDELFFSMHGNTESAYFIDKEEVYKSGPDRKEYLQVYSLRFGK